MKRHISLIGNPNSGKSTLFNELTGANQYVGNWPGVTVEHKHGHVKGDPELELVDLPGLYSLSPYSPEELVARGHLFNDKPDVILNIIDATQLERSLYLTSQLMELGIPMIIALNMLDSLEESGQSINTDLLAEQLGCPVISISALRQKGITELEELLRAPLAPAPAPMPWCAPLEKSATAIQERFKDSRWKALSLLQSDHMLLHSLKIEQGDHIFIEQTRHELEQELQDDVCSIVASERYRVIEHIVAQVRSAAQKETAISMSSRWDRILTHRVFGLAIFAAVMWSIYYISINTLGDWATGWTNDVLFGDIIGGWLGGFIGAETAPIESLLLFSTVLSMCFVLPAGLRRLHDIGLNGSWLYLPIATFVLNYIAAENLPPMLVSVLNYVLWGANALLLVLMLVKKGDASINRYGRPEAGIKLRPFSLAGRSSRADYLVYLVIMSALSFGISMLGTLELNTSETLQALVGDGIVAGVGAVLGFLPQMAVLFLLLSILEDCGYMARVAFMLDRFFRSMGLPGKAFIPMLVSMGCGIPGVMATRTIENERDRRLTIMLTTFMPCGAKLPIIALFALLFGAWGTEWLATIVYFGSLGSIVVGGIMLSKLKCFSAARAPFIMEMPAYHIPSGSGINLRVMERCKSFAKKAGTIIFVASAAIWATSNYNWSFEPADEMNEGSMLADIGNIGAPLLRPIGCEDWRLAVAAVTGLGAKELVVSTFGVLYPETESAEEATEGEEEEEAAPEERSSNLGKVNLLTGLTMLAWQADSKATSTAIAAPVDDATKEAEAKQAEQEEEEANKGVAARVKAAGAFTSISALAFMFFNLLCAPCFAACGAIRREMNHWGWTAFAIGYMTLWAYTIAFLIYQIGMWITEGHFGLGQVLSCAIVALILFQLLRPTPQFEKE